MAHGLVATGRPLDGPGVVASTQNRACLRVKPEGDPHQHPETPMSFQGFSVQKLQGLMLEGFRLVGFGILFSFQSDHNGHVDPQTPFTKV